MQYQNHEPQETDAPHTDDDYLYVCQEYSMPTCRDVREYPLSERIDDRLTLTFVQEGAV